MNERDDGSDRDSREPKPCAVRIGGGAWCRLPDGHEGKHAGTLKPYADPATLFVQHRRNVPCGCAGCVKKPA